MSIKHFNEYYRELEKNYIEMVNGLSELENTCVNQMVTPEMIEQYKLTLQPIKDSFLTLQYVKYLLDKPNRKSKQGRYEKQTKDIEKNRFIKEIYEDRSMLKELKK